MLGFSCWTSYWALSWASFLGFVTGLFGFVWASLGLLLGPIYWAFIAGLLGFVWASSGLEFSWALLLSLGVAGPFKWAVLVGFLDFFSGQFYWVARYWARLAV